MQNEIKQKPEGLWRKRIGYAFGTAPDSVTYTITSIYALFFMTDVVGINPATAGLIMGAGTVICAIVVPIIGIYADNYSSPKGRRYPLMLIFMFMAMFFLALFFLPFNLGPIQVAFLFVTFVCVATIYTSYDVPYYALGAELTDDYNERNNLMLAKNWIAYPICYFAESFVYTMVVKFSEFTGERYAWFLAMLVVVAFVIASTLFSFFMCKRYDHPIERVEKAEKFSLVETFKEYVKILSVKVCRKVMIYNLIFCIGYMIIMNTVTYSLTYCVNPAAGGVDALVAGYWLCNSIMCMVFAPICTFIANRWDKKASVVIFLFISAIWQGIFYFTGLNSFVGVLVWSCANGLAAIAFYSLYQSMLYDTCEVYELKFGEKKEGSIVSMSMFMQALGAGIASFLVGICLNAVGYDASAEVVSEATSKGMLGIATILPAFFIIIGLIWILTHRLNRERYEAVKEALEKRANGEEVDLSQFSDIM
ncbi:MAG: MFS transporter [Firmicutes bacterium]|nr:MFS transporter [Bacillota bacterium]